MKSINKLSVSVASLFFAKLLACAAEIFVSHGGTWKKDGMEGATYSDLQTAINAARNGDTVWIQDGFVCDSGKEKFTYESVGYARIKLPKYYSGVTVRSESGYVDEANGKGATIRGAHDPESAYEDGRGNNAIVPIYYPRADAVVQGLVLEGGSMPDATKFSGGAAYAETSSSAIVLTNCVIRNNSAYSGGAVAGNLTKCYNCVISNNCAFGSSGTGGAIVGTGSYFDCIIADNYTSALGRSGGAVACDNAASSPVPCYSNCVFRGNHSGDVAVAAFTKGETRALFEDCTFVKNRAESGPTSCVKGLVEMRRCVFVDNVATNTTYSYQAGGTVASSQNIPTDAQRVWLSDCVFSNNFTVGSGGGALGAYATNCTFYGNICVVNGGGASRSELVDCRVIDNVSSNFMGNSNSMEGVGGGLCYSVATRCLIAGNKCWANNLISSGSGGGVALCNLNNCIVSNNWARFRGAAVYNICSSTDDNDTYACYNCLIAGNLSDAPNGGYNYGMIIEGQSSSTAAKNPPKFYNCTIVGNTTPNYWAINCAELYNCIVWGNSAPTELRQDCVWADHTCQKDLTAGENGNVNTDPHLTDDYHLASKRPCANAATQYDWMLASNDVRSKDLDGAARIFGDMPDMGCFERRNMGFIIFAR